MVIRSPADIAYLSARKVFSASIGPQELWSIVDHWPLYVGGKNLARALALHDLYRSVAKIPGAVAEFGSWNGASIMLLAKIARIFDANSPRRFLCFDTFEGLPAGVEKDGSGATSTGQYSGNLERLRALIRLYDMEHKIEIHRGLIQNTLPRVLEDESLYFSFVFLDADLYEPTIAALMQCHDRMVSGGVFVFDEWGEAEWPGETIAVREFMDQNSTSYKYEVVSNTEQPSLVLRKI